MFGIYRSSRKSGESFAHQAGWLLAAVALLAGCQAAPAASPAAPTAAPKSQQQAAPTQPAGAQKAEVIFRHSFVNLGQNAAYYLGVAGGHYERQNITATFQEGTGGDTSVKLVANGSAQFGAADAGVALRGVAEGMPIRVVAASIRTHPMGVMSLKESPLKQPADLVGKTVAMPAGSSQAQLLPAFLAVNKIDKDAVKVVLTDAAAARASTMDKRINGHIAWCIVDPLLIEGKLDCLRWADFGFTSLSEVIVAYEPFLAQSPDVARRFLAATQAAWADAAKDPKAAATAQMKVAPLTIAEPTILGAVEGTVKHMDGPNTPGKPWGIMAEADWKATKDLLVQYAGLDASIDLQKVYTNQYLPQS
jgi:NitT/TauT family transport system substrate-binding protein